ncbi:MAG: glycosyl hydrolase [Bryobacteraceae bacterium]|nr:glycosyl hydrolase [Bryobacteraceae bacterium]MDW8379171.1 glycosyl hydrolase [Bryobacterales bacterium]
MRIDFSVSPVALLPKIRRCWELSAVKIESIEASYQPAQGTPVFTREGRYTSRGWTEWTQGFQFGSALLQFDATGERSFLETGRVRTLTLMAPHVSHVGVHDHGFNNISTYGNLRRLLAEGRYESSEWEAHFCELALKISGAVQASRWTAIAGGGFIHSFNGPHSLFVDTIRSLRALAVAHRLGHVLMGENDRRISLLERLIQHASATASYSVYYGEGRDAYDVWGRTAHESIFNTKDGNYRCPNSQQGFSPFTTWTRGLAWAMLGFAEQLEFLDTVEDAELEAYGGRARITVMMRKAALATCEFYLAHTSLDGIPYWDTGAPNLHRLGDYTQAVADPFNPWEPVDASAAAIAAQGLLRFGRWMERQGEDGARFRQAGLTVLATLLEEPYLSTSKEHQGLLLHSVYHRPNGWDYVPPGKRTPCGESSMWGDYHLREVALYVQRLAENQPYLQFWI